MFERFRRDLSRCFSFESRTGNPGPLEALKILATHHPLKGIAVYRFGWWVRNKVSSPALKKPLKITYHVLDEVVRTFWGMHIESSAHVDGGLYIAHANGILIGGATIGRDCNIGSGVIIGLRPGQATGHNLPTLGSNVFIGPSSMLFGGITVADGATIGPLTLVGRNLPPGCLASGNPMQILKKDYDNKTLIYGSRPPPPG